jgi:hypothetical protein
MREVAWGLSKISSGKMKSTLGSQSKSRMLEVVSGKKMSRSKSEMLNQARMNLFFLMFPEIHADAGIFFLLFARN